jgi:hypothetical protein
MSLPGIIARNQSELVQQKMESVESSEQTEILKLPGVTTLHLKSHAEIAAVLTNLLKSRSNITSIKYVLGSHFEIESKR